MRTLIWASSSRISWSRADARPGSTRFGPKPLVLDVMARWSFVNRSPERADAPSAATAPHRDEQGSLHELSSDGQRSKNVALNVRQGPTVDAVGNREVGNDLIESSRVRRTLRPLLGNGGCELSQALGRFGVEVEQSGNRPIPPNSTFRTAISAHSSESCATTESVSSSWSRRG